MNTSTSAVIGWVGIALIVTLFGIGFELGWVEMPAQQTPSHCIGVSK